MLQWNILYIYNFIHAWLNLYDKFLEKEFSMFKSWLPGIYCKIALHRSCIGLHTCQQYIILLISPYTYQHSVLLIFLVVAYLIVKKQWVSVALICTFLISSEVVHYFIHSGAFFLSFSVNCLFIYFVHFPSSLLVFSWSMFLKVFLN